MAALRYIVAATPRTGSSLLCEGLCATGVAGYPGEVFAPDFRHLWCDHWYLRRDVRFADYLDAAVTNGKTDNGVFGFKIMRMHVPVLARAAGLPTDDVLDRLFPGSRFVYIRRLDRAAQVRSWQRAEVTGQWWRFEGEAAAPEPDEAPDPAYLRLMEEHVERQQEQWETHFAARGIEPVRVVYEDLTRDYRGEIGRVLAALGLDPDAATTIPPPRLVRQAPVGERVR